MKANPAISLLSRLRNFKLLGVLICPPETQADVEHHRRRYTHRQQVKDSVVAICFADTESEAQTHIFLKQYKIRILQTRVSTLKHKAVFLLQNARPASMQT